MTIKTRENLIDYINTLSDTDLETDLDLGEQESVVKKAMICLGLRTLMAGKWFIQPF